MGDPRDPVYTVYTHTRPLPGLSHCDTRVTVTSGSFIVIPALNTVLGRSFFLGNVFSGS